MSQIQLFRGVLIYITGAFLFGVLIYIVGYKNNIGLRKRRSEYKNREYKGRNDIKFWIIITYLCILACLVMLTFIILKYFIRGVV
ncbi:hypothetical protein I5677_06985 [Mobilitalea sibirica]|uniref:Uncharacterized protein n=1 Tax=Mobilitalea sibirica TaxID=1462919 RepID=A0A8J7GYL2_9FIRM|nr:hypothetical protein [Mobilitalea sibirica]MBH1940629.1 hypothetical protein [Mobilitalea sibirica]